MNKTAKILIVEDEVLIADFIYDLLTDEGYKNIEIAYDFSTAIQKIEMYRPDVLLLDVNIGKINCGITVAKQKNEEAHVIYITAQNDEATIQKAIETEPVAYLTKPIKKFDLFAALKLAIYKKNTKYIVLKDGYEEFKVNVSDILYIKSDNIYIDVVTKSKKYSIRRSLESIQKELQSFSFVKIHRSYLVNVNAITKKSSRLVFIDEIELPLSRKYKLDL